MTPIPWFYNIYAKDIKKTIEFLQLKTEKN